MSHAIRSVRVLNPTQVFWLECDSSQSPSDDLWLADIELERCRKRWTRKRREDWLLGRWTAKCAVASYLGVSIEPEILRTITILAEETGAPNVYVEGRLSPCSLSISHCDGKALALISPPSESVGCDLEKIEARGAEFRETFFTNEEMEQLENRWSRSQPGFLETLIWSAKETVLKVQRVGLRVDTRSVSVEIKRDPQPGSEWKSFSAKTFDGQHFTGWWHASGNLVKTISASRPSQSPIALQLDHHVQCNLPTAETTSKF